MPYINDDYLDSTSKPHTISQCRTENSFGSVAWAGSPKLH
jgi:hypothetical protein